MAVGLIFTGKGVTQAQYEQVRDEVTPGNKLAPGVLYHAAGPSPDGWCVIEVWESQEVAEQFFKTKLEAALKRANITAQPAFFQVQNIMEA